MLLCMLISPDDADALQLAEPGEAVKMARALGVAGQVPYFGVLTGREAGGSRPSERLTCSRPVLAQAP